MRNGYVVTNKNGEVLDDINEMMPWIDCESVNAESGTGETATLVPATVLLYRTQMTAEEGWESVYANPWLWPHRCSTSS